LILEDSDYEDDAVVFKKYRSKNSMISNDNPIENPLVYITKNSTAKRLALE